MLLNTVGYYEVLIAIEKRHRDYTISKISENEGEISGNLLLRIPRPSHFNQDDNEYSRAFGEIVIESQVYHFVKKKLYQDTLYIVCINDPLATQVKNTISDYSKSFADHHQKSDSNEGTVSSFAKFYLLWDSSTLDGLSASSKVLRSSAVQKLYNFSSPPSIFHPPC
jgi:hypothetical protein